jgi:hypothetical protein
MQDERLRLRPGHVWQHGRRDVLEHVPARLDVVVVDVVRVWISKCSVKPPMKLFVRYECE